MEVFSVACEAAKINKRSAFNSLNKNSQGAFPQQEVDENSLRAFNVKL